MFFRPSRVGASAGAQPGVRSDAATRHAMLIATVAGVSALAWVGLVLWERSPWGRYLDHGDWTARGLAAQVCSAVPGGAVIVPAALYASGWLLMIAAMMLPTTLPVLLMFRRLTAQRDDRNALVALVVGGYVAAWLGFGLAAHAADWVVHRAVQASPWLSTRAWVVGVAVLAGAGLFQFSALKRRCLERCRNPMGFVVGHWHGDRPRAGALRLGVDHGIFCVGCCWALMLLMFVVGTGSLGWMLVLGAVMAVEKNLAWGRRIGTPLGVALIGWALWTAALNA